jgi:hydroxymethylpyrimidine/phosphomethylpyrimidine kinase
MSMKTVLTIGGHDLSNGAGITKDLEVFAVQGCHGISVPTSLVVQGPGGARSIAPVPERLFAEMLRRAAEDFNLSGIKIGALADAGHVEIVAEFLAAEKGVPVVLDPVAATKNGLKLVTDDGFKAVVGRLFPLITCVTPNTDEARLLLGTEIDGVSAMERAARSITGMGPHSVVLKGGHLPGEPVDLLFDGTDAVIYGKRRIERTVHGTGCMFSSTLLALLARGYPVKEAFLETERIMERLITGSAQPGSGGYFYAFPGVDAGRDAERWAVLQAMLDAASRLEELNMQELIPASRMGLGYALSGARNGGDVAAFPGGIGLRRGRVHFKGPPGFGASSQAAALCLACMKYYPFVRSAAAINYDQRTVARAREIGLSTISTERRKGPGAGDLVVESALERTDGPPDIIYDRADAGKDGIIRLFARDPQELIKKMEMIRPCTTN